jgi:prepilin-type N-terminal cleavage/methylation domain-containing protein
MDNIYNRVSRRRRQGQGGFTLIELLVVIAVLAILATIVLFNILGVSNRGKLSACQTDKQTVQTAVDAYYNDKGQVFPAATDTATPAAGVAVNLTELTGDKLLITAPTSGTFTYTGDGGTVAAKDNETPTPQTC